MNAQEFETLLAHYDEAVREGQTLAFISPESGAELIEYARQLRDEGRDIATLTADLLVTIENGREEDRDALISRLRDVLRFTRRAADKAAREMSG